MVLRHIYIRKKAKHNGNRCCDCVLPLGFLGEDAAESRHKIYKADRLHHARKSSRTNNILDIFNRAMDTSDPLISSINLSKRMQQRKRLQLPQEVIEMLKCHNPNEELESEIQSIINQNVEEIDEKYDESDDYNEDGLQSYVNILNDLDLENEVDII